MVQRVLGVSPGGGPGGGGQVGRWVRRSKGGRGRGRQVLVQAGPVARGVGRVTGRAAEAIGAGGAGGAGAALGGWLHLGAVRVSGETGEVALSAPAAKTTSSGALRLAKARG